MSADNVQALQTDQDGNIIVSPVLGWASGPLPAKAVFLAVQYAERPEEIETGGKSIQFVLTPQQCLELAQRLTKLANDVILS